MARRTTSSTPAASANAGAADDLDHRIVEDTLALAEQVGWEGVRLRLVAERLDIPLNALGNRYRDLDAIADAWLGRGVAAMLAPMPADFAERPANERIETAILRFLDALAPHRRVTASMIAAKLWPSHPHHWVPLVFNLSRTVHWIREAALLDAGGVRRQRAEVALTALLVATFAVWCRDRSEGQDRTRRFLHRSLADGSRCCGRLLRRRGVEPRRDDEPAAA
jgi:AcrR family transcriptional regulator